SSQATRCGRRIWRVAPATGTWSRTARGPGRPRRYCVTDSIAGRRRSIGAPDSKRTSTLAAAPAGAAWIGTASRGAGGSSAASGLEGWASAAVAAAVATAIGVTALGLTGLTRTGGSEAGESGGPTLTTGTAATAGWAIGTAAVSSTAAGGGFQTAGSPAGPPPPLPSG